MEEVEGYRKEKLTIDLVKANRTALFWLLPITLIYAVPYLFVWWGRIDLKEAWAELLGSGRSWAIVVSAMFMGIVVHELIHGLVWSLFAKQGFRSIRFGVLWKYLTPYCHCKDPLQVRHYILGALAPAFFLGVLPGIWAIITGSFPLLLFGIFFTVAAMGDFLIVNLIRKEDPDALVQDHPSEAGCYIYRTDTIHRP